MDFSHFYRNTPQKSLHEDLTSIVSGFSDLLKNGSSARCKLVNYYKGLPVAYPATPVEIHQGTLELDVNQQQAAALEGSRYVFIKCDYFESAILGEVRDVNVPKATVSLHNFSFVEILAERRTSIRLEVVPQTDAEMRSGSLIIPAKLRDVSLGGFSLIPAEPCDLEPGSEVELTVLIPNLLQGREDRLNTTATLVETITRDSYSVCRFSFDPDQQSENLISRFIFQRQVEIIKELKERS
ncbi:PilZ domain-containing protein [Geomesophilobacter sediminis]|uniref:PilZ domain-containing protein n=1 Tax=Geomesophilobacter sediminis TaxID=2798584 RepID=A0A8J7LY32_9BACT|nr:PilZ domain-containing protein [Geomesophilobacter sediminis]MBJ6724027.1 PilZ domain-containing protein [Geomesophilobacter sediminis]